MKEKPPFKVVAIGVTNAGKSSLLSALVDARGKFASRDVPNFTKGIQRELSGDLELVDTPGLDVSDLATQAAKKEARTADMVLWCHSLRTGELRQLELAALKRLLPSLGPNRFRLVLTHADNLAGPHVVKEVVAKIFEQLRGVLRKDPCHLTGVQAYWASKEGGAKAARLRFTSGVPRLRNLLEEAARAPRRAKRGTG